MTNKPLVSIVTPSYNQGVFIEDNIRSVLNQDYQNIEHIILDGNSEDRTIDILKRYDDRLTWISEEDKGQASAINKGFKLANGAIIGSLNSDDVLFHKKVVNKIVETFLQVSNVDVCYGNVAILNKNNEILRVKCASDFNYSRLFRRKCFIPQPGSFFKRKIVRENKLEAKLNFAFDYE